MNKPQTGFAPVHRGRLYYEVIGEGYPLVLLHAGIADLRMWDDQIPAFAQRYRTIRYDLRGYGQSESEATEFSHRQDLNDLLDHLGVTKTHLIGLSMGGQIAVDFTLEHPERVSSLIPVAPGLSGYESKSGDDAKSQFEIVQFTRMDELWEKKDMDALLELELQMWVDGPMQPRDRVPAPLRERVRQMTLQAGTHLNEGAQAQPLVPPAFGRLHEIHVPTLVIFGDLDTTGIIARCEVLARDIPGARDLMIPDTAHMLPMEKPDAFNHAVLEFLEEVTAL